MPIQLQKLDPRYTVYLRGFDGFGAAASITGADERGFLVSGVFRDAADFAVVVLYDADDFFGHPRLKYLPDFDLSGLVLSFDVSYSTGLQPIDSAKYPTIDWPYLDVARPDGSTARVHLFDHATQVGGSHAAALATFTLTAAPAAAYDRVTIWFENRAFDYIAGGGETAEYVAAALATQINGVNWGGTQAITARANGAQLTILAAKPGVDGNMVTLYAQSKTATLQVSPNVLSLAGGASNAVWRVTLDFSALGIASVRQMWLTIAPALANGAAYEGSEWLAGFSNWSVMGDNRALQVAGPGSVRVEDSDRWCSLRGSWSRQAGFYSRGFALASLTKGDSVTVEYWCQREHDLYLGTSLYQGRGSFTASVDGDDETLVATLLNSDSEVPARRLIRSSLSAGRHQVVLTHADNNPVVFDFFEAAVPSDVPDPPGASTNRAPALDYDTDHAYKLPPARIAWMLQALGYQAELNLYMGVFWWMQKMRSGGTIPAVTVDFAQTTYADGSGGGDGDQVFLDIGGELFGKTVFPADTAASIAQHFACYINEEAAGVWASAAGSVLTITARASAYSFSFAAYKNTTAQTLASNGLLAGGVASDWVIDANMEGVLNAAARLWLNDLALQCAAMGVGLVVSFSMELVNPPAGWAARYPDGTPVLTATGFGALNSTQCAPGCLAFLQYQQRAFVGAANIVRNAGLAVVMQCGEFLWWYFAGASGMAYYDGETQDAALRSLGRPLHVFHTPNDDPTVNGTADATFLRDRLRDHVATIGSVLKAGFPCSELEVLYAYDVNYPSPSGAFNVGGRLNAYVNTPLEWGSPGILDRIKIEALDRGASSRDLNLARPAMVLAARWGWPKNRVRYLMPVYNGGCPWERELLAAEAQGLAEVVLYAFDHICLFGWQIGVPAVSPTAQWM